MTPNKDSLLTLYFHRCSGNLSDLWWRRVHMKRGANNLVNITDHLSMWLSNACYRRIYRSQARQRTPVSPWTWNLPLRIMKFNLMRFVRLVITGSALDDFWRYRGITLLLIRVARGWFSFRNLGNKLALLLETCEYSSETCDTSGSSVMDKVEDVKETC